MMFDGSKRRVWPSMEAQSHFFFFVFNMFKFQNSNGDGDDVFDIPWKQLLPRW